MSFGKQTNPGEQMTVNFMLSNQTIDTKFDGNESQRHFITHILLEAENFS
jgi:hypothetical protein